MIMALSATTAVTIGKLCTILAPVVGAAVTYAVNKNRERKVK